MSLGIAASPRLSLIMPRGIQRGVEHVLTFTGGQLGDAQEILFYEPGIQVRNSRPKETRRQSTVAVDADCRLGEHLAQVRTASGLSDFRTFWVEALPTVAEKEPNTDFDAPQPIAMNVTVGGTIDNEDVDYYVVEATKGQRISAEVVAMRLGSAMFDPYVAILDSKRFELSAQDDTALALQDAFASIIAPADGPYIIEVRESAYAGGSHYRLHVGTFPRPAVAFPAGGKVGELVDVRLLGLPDGELTQQVAVPAEPQPEFGIYAEDPHGIAPSPNLFRVVPFGNAFEQEPNNDVAEATAVELPLAFNGIIAEPGDVDCFKFAARQGEVYDVECYARRVRSPLDPVMNLYQADGKGLAGNDDSRGPDSYFRWTVAADGEYVVRVTDHLGSGGPNHVYRIEFTKVEPRLALGIPRVERYGQYRQQIFVARGNRYGTLVTASRSDFGGDLVLDPQGLPDGIQMVAPRMPANLNTMPVVFEATPDAPLAGRLIEFTARHADETQAIRGHFQNRADLVNAEPNQTVYYAADVDKLAVAVVEELPFSIEIVQPRVPLVRGGSMQLKVVATRQDGFDKAISVQFPFRPPGLGAANAVTIPAGQNEVLYPLNANGNAAIGDWNVFALASADVGGAAWASSQMATLKIAEPYVTFEVQRASCEQGQIAQVYCKIQHHTPFAGTAQARLLGLPANVTATEPQLEFTKDTSDLTFGLQTTAESPEGSHKTLFCEVTITEHDEPIVSHAGGTELQIDKPLPAPAAPATSPPPATPVVSADQPPAPPATEKPPKPLTRLEKLRLAAQERAAARAARQESEK